MTLRYSAFSLLCLAVSAGCVDSNPAIGDPTGMCSEDVQTLAIDEVARAGFTAADVVALVGVRREYVVSYWRTPTGGPTSERFEVLFGQPTGDFEDVVRQDSSSDSPCWDPAVAVRMRLEAHASSLDRDLWADGELVVEATSIDDEGVSVAFDETANVSDDIWQEGQAIHKDAPLNRIRLGLTDGTLGGGVLEVAAEWNSSSRTGVASVYAGDYAPLEGPADTTVD